MPRDTITNIQNIATDKDQDIDVNMAMDMDMDKDPDKDKACCSLAFEIIPRNNNISGSHILM